MLGFKLAAQKPPKPERVTDVVVSRFEHVLEVDPALMTEHVRQQDIPNWDFRRIVAARWEHIRDIHDQFADAVVLAGQGSDLDNDNASAHHTDR